MGNNKSEKTKINILSIEDSINDYFLLEENLKDSGLNFDMNRIETEKQLVFMLENNGTHEFSGD